MTEQRHSAIAQSSLLLATLYGLAALLSLFLSRSPGSIAALWYANAVAIAFLMHRPVVQWPWLLSGVTAANALANMAWGDPWQQALMFLLPNLVEVALAASLIRWAGLHRQSIEDPARLLKLTLLGCVAAPGVGAAVGALLISGGLATNFWSVAQSWMASAMVGGASILPLSVLIHRQGLRPLRVLTTNPLFWGLLTTAVGLTLLVHAYLPYPFVYTVLPLMVSAMTLPMLGTAIITLAVSLTLGIMMMMGIFVPPPTIWEWQQMFVYMALAAALIPAQVLSAARSVATSTQERLSRSAASLEKANQGLQQFIRMSSHDLREPVNTVSQFTGLLQEDHLTDLPPRAQAHLKRVGHAAQRMRTLLDDVVQFATLAQTPSVNLGPVDLNRCLLKAREQMSTVVTSRQADITVGTLPVVQGNGDLLQMLVNHLLDNALKFVPPDRAPVIDINAQIVQDMATIRMSDNGIGIDPIYASRLFEPFARLTTRRQYSGSGLGLAVCRQIVEMHHGTISIQPGQSQGVVVEFTLPLAR